MLYEARPADQLSPATVTNLSNGWFDLVLFFSPRTAATFVALARAAGDDVVSGCSKAAALCLSPAVAAAAGEIVVARRSQAAARPELAALLDLIDRERAARATSAGKETSARRRPTKHPMRRRRRSSRRRGGSRLGRHRRGRRGDGHHRRACHQPPVGLVAGIGPVLAQRLSDLEKAHEATASGVAIMRDTVGTLVGDARSTSDRVAALESARNAPSGIASDLAPLTKRLDALEREIAALHVSAQQPVQPTPAADLSP